jgi:hypothetical protein
MVLPKEQLFASEFYADFLRARDVHSILTAYLLDNAATRVAFGRVHRAGEWEQEQIDCLRLLAPHLCRAAQTNLRLEATEILKEGASDALDRLAHSVMIVDAESRPLFVNRAAEALLRQGDGLRIDCQGLCATFDARETSSIRRLVATPADEQIRISPAPVLVSRRCARPPLAILVVPMRASSVWFSQKRPAAIVLISDPDQAVRRER